VTRARDSSEGCGPFTLLLGLEAFSRPLFSPQWTMFFPYACLRDDELPFQLVVLIFFDPLVCDLLRDLGVDRSFSLLQGRGG